MAVDCTRNNEQYKKIENAEKDALSASFSCRCLEKHYKKMSV